MANTTTPRPRRQTRKRKPRGSTRPVEIRLAEAKAKVVRLQNALNLEAELAKLTREK